eukprot:jgi/Tetstr1/449844/TSEL_036907.t1
MEPYFGGPARGCFVRELSGKDGVNWIVMHPSGRIVITGGTEEASRGMMAPESGWQHIIRDMFADHIMTESNCEQGPGIENEDTFGNILPPVTAAATHPHMATAATGHGSHAGSAKGGGCFVIICKGSTIRLWNWDTGDLINAVEAHEGGGACLTIHSFIRDYSHMMAEHAPSEAATPTSQDDGLRSKLHMMVESFARKSKSAVEK